MTGSAIRKPLTDLVAWVDRWVTAAGKACCVGRAQSELRETIANEEEAGDERHPPVRERA